MAPQNDPEFVRACSRWVKALRKRANLTQARLASITGTSIESVSRWELAQTQPYAENLLALMALATEQEREALVGKVDLDDTMHTDTGDPATCNACGLPMRLRDYTTRGWPAPPRVQRESDPYAVRKCVRCQNN